MPGITGFVRAVSLAAPQATLDQMLGCMLHERFYASGSLLQPNLGLGVGWVNHPDAFCDGNPFWNPARDVCLVFWGEHFGVDEDDGVSSLLRQYETEGDGFLKRLNGVFSGLLLDLRKSKVILFNDRYGLGRIYYHESADGFYFSSEAKSLLRIFPGLRRLDWVGFGEFFSCGCALEGRTLFDGVQLLPPASAWTFDRGQPVQKGVYFNRATWENQPPIAAEEYFERLDTTFTRILPRYLRGKLKVGLSLTGGLDSRMILACKNALPSQMPCYTFGGPYRDCADVRLARQLADASGFGHDTIGVTDDFFKQFPDLARRAVCDTDGEMDVMGSVEVFVNRVARQIAPVRITGNYGSEILRGNVAFKPMPISTAMFERSFAAQVRRSAATYASAREGVPTSFIAFKQVPWHHHARFAVESSQLLPRSPYLDNEIVALAYQAPRDLSLNKSLALRFIESHDPSLAAIPTDRGVTGSRQAKAGRFASWCRELPPKAEYMMDYGMPQWLAKIDRFASATRWERIFLGRQKFYHFRVWYRDQLSDFVKETLLDRRALGRAYLDGRRVERMVNAHTSGWANHTLEIHKLITSELITRHLLEQN